MQPAFAPPSERSRVLRERIGAWVRSEEPSVARGRMRRKTAIIGAWFGASYVLLVFVASSPWSAVPLALSLGLAAAAVGMNVQHDANHGAWPTGRRARRVLGFSLDVLGGSSYVWRYKHNRSHHQFTNIAGADNDVDLRPFGRLSPVHPRRWFHRFQHIYLWPLYGFMPLAWHLVEDYVQVARGKIAEQPFPRPRGRALVGFVGGKLAAAVLWFGLPLLLHPPLVVLGFVLLVGGVLGVVLAVVFQLAHATEVAAFPAETEDEWLVHQLRTTADFAQRRRALTWFLGGLNFQVEHHLFPGVPHVRYPALARVLRQTCAELELPYVVHRSFGAALAAHYRWLRALGAPPAAPVLLPPTPVAG